MRVAILTVSDSCAKGLRRDTSGTSLKCLLKKDGMRLIRQEIVADEKDLIRKKIKFYADQLKVDLVLTTGGTGLGPRDVTPEATRAIITKEIPGIPELMRFKIFEKTERAALSRAIAGLRAKTLIINLPGSLKGSRESYRSIAGLIPHALMMIRGLGHEETRRK